MRSIHYFTSNDITTANFYLVRVNLFVCAQQPHPSGETAWNYSFFALINIKFRKFIGQISRALGAGTWIFYNQHKDFIVSALLVLLKMGQEQHLWSNFTKNYWHHKYLYINPPTEIKNKNPTTMWPNYPSKSGTMWINSLSTETKERTSPRLTSYGAAQKYHV